MPIVNSCIVALIMCAVFAELLCVDCDIGLHCLITCYAMAVCNGH
jgi:hypothetical protein